MREVVTRDLVWPASALLHPRTFSCLHRVNTAEYLLNLLTRRDQRQILYQLEPQGNQYKAERAMCHSKGSDEEKLTSTWWRTVSPWRVFHVRRSV
ncbi:hypothetical protein CapIbe_021269 [Capra ibex]